MKYEALRKLVVDALEELKAVDITQLDIEEKSSFTNLMIVATGTSSRHVTSLSSHVIMACKKKGVVPIGVSGERDGEWVAIDLGDIVLHVMQPQIRDYYNLEKLWEVEVADMHEPVPKIG